MSEPMTDKRLDSLERQGREGLARPYLPTFVVAECVREIRRLREDNERLQRWVNDLQSGMYVNCIYCGHQYGPREDTPVSMADVLKEHVERCPKHPMSKLLKENGQLRKENEWARELLEQSKWDRCSEGQAEHRRKIRAFLDGEDS